MKKSNTSVLLLVFWLGLLYSTAAQDKFEDYTDDKHGFSLKYPTNWQIIHMHGYIWTARSELMNIKDKFEDMVQISTHSLHPSEYNGREFDVANLYARKKLAAIEKMPNTKVLAIEKALFKDIPAVRIIYLAKNKTGHEVKCSELYAVKNKKIWTFSYIACREDYDHWLPYVEKIWDSFKFIAIKK